MALDHSAMFWVAATLWDTSILIYEAVVAPLRSAEKDQSYAETVTFCRLFGLSTSTMPADWTAFRTYFDDMLGSETLHVGQTARMLGERVLRPPRKLAIPLSTCVDFLTAGLMPPALRDAYGIPFERRHRSVFESTLKLARRDLPVLPDSLRDCPPYLDAQRRVGGRGSQDPVAETWKRFVSSVLRKPDGGA